MLKCFFAKLTWESAWKYFHRNDVDDWPWCYKNLSTLWHRHLHENNFAQIMSMIDLGVWRIFLHLDMGICMKKVAQISTFNSQIVLEFTILLSIIKNLISIWNFHFKFKKCTWNLLKTLESFYIFYFFPQLHHTLFVFCLCKDKPKKKNFCIWKTEGVFSTILQGVWNFKKCFFNNFARCLKFNFFFNIFILIKIL